MEAIQIRRLSMETLIENPQEEVLEFGCKFRGTRAIRILVGEKEIFGVQPVAQTTCLVQETLCTLMCLRSSNKYRMISNKVLRDFLLTTTTKQTQNYMIEQKKKNTLKTKVISLYQETPKQFLNPTPTPKIARQGPKKSKMAPKLSQNQISESKVTQKMKVVQLHEQTPKQCLSPSRTPKIARQGPQKVKNDLKIKLKVNVRIERNKANESCSTT